MREVPQRVQAERIGFVQVVDHEE
jgi:hypothetical protein